MVFSEMGRLMAAHGVEPKGVVHVGAHKGEEVLCYVEYGFKRIVLFEPNPSLDIYAALREHLRHESVEWHNCAIASKSGPAMLHVTARSQLCSLLPTPDSTVTFVEAHRLDEFDLTGCNVLVVDVQGAELDVLQSTKLDQFDMVIVEIDESGRYPVDAQEVLLFLYKAGFGLVDAFPHHHDTKIQDGAWVRRDMLSACAPAP